MGAAIERVWRLHVDSAHPAAHGPLELLLQVDASSGAEIITFAEPNIAAIHRGAEKLFESRDYRQILMLADRHDWHSAFGSELGLALTIESLLGIAVPPRATWIRTALAELNRAIHHLRWLGETVGALPSSVADPALASRLRNRARVARELLTELQEMHSGGRLHPMAVVPGGLRDDLADGWLAEVPARTRVATEVTAELTAFVGKLDALESIGVLPLKLATQFATSGPVARASGLQLDLRLDEPYLFYGELAGAGVLQSVHREGGSTQDRLAVLAEETTIALACIDYAVDQLAHSEPGPVSVRLPRSIRVPEGTGYGWTENPTGINGWFLVSKGGPIPYRLKLRTASYNNAQALCALLRGTDVALLPTTMMSFLLVAGDLAK